MVNMTAESIKNLPSSLWYICITRYWRNTSDPKEKRKADTEGTSTSL